LTIPWWPHYLRSLHFLINKINWFLLWHPNDIHIPDDPLLEIVSLLKTLWTKPKGEGVVTWGLTLCLYVL
jgi:hypothetical protein